MLLYILVRVKRVMNQISDMGDGSLGKEIFFISTLKVIKQIVIFKVIDELTTDHTFHDLTYYWKF